MLVSSFLYHFYLGKASLMNSSCIHCCKQVLIDENDVFVLTLNMKSDLKGCYYIKHLQYLSCFRNVK